MRQLRSPRVFMAKRDKKLRMNHPSQLQLRYRFSIYPHIKMDLSLNTCPIYASKMDMFHSPERQDDFPKTTRAFSMSGRLPLPLPFGFSCGVIVMTRDDRRGGEGFKKRTNKSNLKCPGPEYPKKHKIWKWGTGEHPWSSITFQYPCSFDDSQSRIFFVDTLLAQTECEPPLALFHPTRAISLDLELVAAFPSHPWKTKQRFEMWLVSYLEKAKLFHCPEISQDPCC